MSCHNPAYRPCRRAAQAPLGLVMAPVMSLAVLFTAGQAAAANWEFAPLVSGSYIYNDNYRLSLPGAEIQVSGAEASAAATLRNIDPRTKFEITPRIDATYFPDEPDQESVDYYLDGIFEDKTPRHTIGITGNFASEDVVRSELPNPDVNGGLGNPQSVDSGNTLQENRRDLVRVAPYFSYDMTERTRLELNARYLNANFEKHYPGSQEDFSEFGAAAGVAWLLTPRQSLTFRALGGRYETTFYTDSYGGDVEWGTDFSETSRMYVRVGGLTTKPENGETNTNVIGGIGGQWTSQRNMLFIDFTRQVTPISAGTVVARHQLRLRVDHAISQRVNVVVSGRGSRDEQIQGLGTYPTRKYAAAEAGIEFRMTRALSVTATYNYRWQEYADEPSDRSGNGFLLGLVWEPKRRDKD